MNQKEGRGEGDREVERLKKWVRMVRNGLGDQFI